MIFVEYNLINICNKFKIVGEVLLMKYLEKAFNFLFKYYLLLVPMYVATVIPALLFNSASSSGVGQMMGSLGNVDYLASNPEAAVQLIGPMALSMIGFASAGGFIAFVLKFIVFPATCGMINKGIDTGSVDLSDFTPSLSQNIKKYLFYWLGTIVVGIIVAIVVAILFIIFGLLAGALKQLGFILMIFVMIALFIAGIAVAVLLSLWFPSMVTDNLSVMEGLKKSVNFALANFWSILGVTVVVIILSALASGIVGAIVGRIPILGVLIVQIIPTFTSVLLLTFYFMFYKEKNNQAVVE